MYNTSSAIDRYIGKKVEEVNERLSAVKAPFSISRLPENIQKGSSWKGETLYFPMHSN